MNCRKSHSAALSVAVFTTAFLAIITSAFAETYQPGASGRQWSILVRGGVTSGDGGKQPQFSALLTHPGPGRISYGVGVGYEQAYALNIIPVFVDLRLTSVAPEFFGGTPGLFLEAGYSAVFGDIFDSDDLRLSAIRVRQLQGNRPSIDGEGYYLNFGLSLTRQLNSTFSSVLEFGSKIQSIPPLFRTSDVFLNTGLPNTNQNPGAKVLGGTSLDLEFPQSGRRGTISSLSVTLGLRF